MKANILVALLALLALSAALPYKEKIALHNSLQVGRDEDPMTWGCTGCTEQTRPIRSHVIEEKVEDVKAILSVYDEYTVLAFRYTATIKNVWYDILWAFQRQDEHAPKGCKVQKHFDNMWNSIRDDTFDDLKASIHTGRLIITGISLGGGLSMLSYVDISHAGFFDDIEIITFGAPRVGNKQWAEWFTNDLKVNPIHFCLNNDPICVLPICFTGLCTYRHSGTAVKCRQKTAECVQQSSFQDNFSVMEIDFRTISKGLTEYRSELIDSDDETANLDGILTHIFGYKKMSDYTYVA